MRRWLLRPAAGLAVLLLIAPPAAAGTRVVIKGGGYGHGIGMSQWGAYGYALHGVGATRILTHYYTGTRIRKVAGRSIRVGVLPAYGGARSSVAFSSVSPPFRSGGGKITLTVPGRSRAVARGNIGDSFVVKASPTGGMRIYKNGDRVTVNGVSVFAVRKQKIVLRYRDFGSVVHVDSKYDYAHGHMNLETYPTSSCTPGYCMRLVAVVPMQAYLYGLAEVPSSWPAAALRAQAIAGRTYAFSKLRASQHRYPCDCAVYDSSVDQVYDGDSRRTQPDFGNWKEAVNGTHGKVIEYHGKPIQALYSASSGGHTENNENVWGGAPVPYLRGVPDPYDDTAANPYHRWKVTMSWRHFADLLSTAYGVGRLKRVKLNKPFGVSGRVTVVKRKGDRLVGGATVVGSRSRVRVSGWSLHGVLGLRDTLFRIALRYTVGKRFVTRYQALDGAPGRPQGRVYGVPRGAAHRRGVAQDFSHGRMTWRRKTGKVVWQHGPVLHKYDDMKRERSGLGMPTSDVWGPGSYLGATYVRGVIVWTKSHGAWAVWGVFLPGYRHAGGVKGPLGVPAGGRHRSAELPHGGRVQHFEGGDLYLNPHAGKAYALWGRIARRYVRIGMATSACGYPVARERETASGYKALFQHGVMKLSSGTLTVHC